MFAGFTATMTESDFSCPCIIGYAGKRSDSKQAKLIEMLKRPDGATIDEIVKKFERQPHTVRGAIAGALKKKLRLDVQSEKIEGRGRVTDAPQVLGQRRAATFRRQVSTASLTEVSHTTVIGTGITSVSLRQCCGCGIRPQTAS